MGLPRPVTKEFWSFRPCPVNSYGFKKLVEKKFRIDFYIEKIGNESILPLLTKKIPSDKIERYLKDLLYDTT